MLDIRAEIADSNTNIYNTQGAEDTLVAVLQGYTNTLDFANDIRVLDMQAYTQIETNINAIIESENTGNFEDALDSAVNHFLTAFELT